MAIPTVENAVIADSKKDADYVFYELTRTICPECRRVVDGHVLIRDNKVYMRKRCPEHGVFERHRNAAGPPLEHDDALCRHREPYCGRRVLQGQRA